VISKVGNEIREKLVAHRGDHEHCPENSMPAFERAVSAGARWLECDIQFTADLIPVILHDNHLLRLCGVDASISQYREESFAGLRLHEPEGPGVQSGNTPVPRLDQLLLWLEHQAGVNLFLEIKTDILSRRRPEEIAALLAPMLERRQAGTILISSSAGILRTLDKLFRYPLGWVMQAGEPLPGIELEYLFVRRQWLLQALAMRRQGMKVAVYTVNATRQFHRCLDMGADLVETDCYGRLATGLISRR